MFLLLLFAIDSRVSSSMNEVYDALKTPQSIYNSDKKFFADVDNTKATLNNQLNTVIEQQSIEDILQGEISLEQLYKNNSVISISTTNKSSVSYTFFTVHLLQLLLLLQLQSLRIKMINTLINMINIFLNSLSMILI